MLPVVPNDRLTVTHWLKALATTGGLALLGALAVGACHGGSPASDAASSPAGAASPMLEQGVSPAAATGACKTRPLEFRPRAGRVYGFSSEERYTSDEPSTRRKLYESKLSFAQAASSGWTASESAFAIPFQPWSYEDPAGATLVWQLDKRGVPQGPPEERGFQRPDFLRHLSLFDFWPVGVVLPSTCPSDEGDLSWDDGGRPRTVHFRVLDVEAGRVRMRVEILRGTWRLEGTLEVALDDGLTGEAHLHEVGPGAPRVNDNQRVIRVRREGDEPRRSAAPLATH